MAYVTHNGRLRTVHRGKLRLESSLGNGRFLPVRTYATRRCGRGTGMVFMYIGNCSLSSVGSLLRGTSSGSALVVPVLGICNANPHVKRLIPRMAMLSKYVCVMNFISKPNRVARVNGVFQLIFNTHPRRNITPRHLRAVTSMLEGTKVGTSVSSSVGHSAFVG